METTQELRRAQAWLGTLLPPRSSLRKRTEANDPGRAGAISRRWSPEGPLSTLIIYEMLPPSGVIRKRKKKKESKVGEEKEKKCEKRARWAVWRGAGEALRTGDYRGPFMAVTLEAGRSKEGSESTWRAFTRGAKVSSRWFAHRCGGGCMSPQPGCWQNPARVCGEREAPCPRSFMLMFTCSFLF